MTNRKTEWTRRRFIQYIGASAGAAAALRTARAINLVAENGAYNGSPDLPPGSGTGKRVIILGAGIAGMTAAYELSKAGYSCIILEAAERAGGRNLTVRAGDNVSETDSSQVCQFDYEDHLYLNLGPARIPYHHRAILDYCRQFGVDLEVFTNDNRGALFHNQERFGGKPQFARRVMTDTRGYIAEFLAKAVNQHALDGRLSAQDKELFVAMLREFGDLDENLFYAGSSRGGYKDQINAGLEPGEKHDPLDLSELLNSDFWQFKLHFSEFIDQNPTLLQPIGGMDAIVQAFERHVGTLIRYDSVVTQIRNKAQGVSVVYRSKFDSQEVALGGDFVICTIPAPVLKRIPNNLKRSTRRVIEGIEFASAVKVGYQAPRFWEEQQAIYGGISWTDQDITQIWYPCYGYHRSNGILLGAYIFDEQPALRFTHMTPDKRLAVAASEGERLHPGYQQAVSRGISHAWLKVPYQFGSWPRGAVGSSYVAPPELRIPDGAVYFAGDQVSALSGWQEGAVLSAHAALRAINDRVMKG